jgi:hypothetical protein
MNCKARHCQEHTNNRPLSALAEDVWGAHPEDAKQHAREDAEMAAMGHVNQSILGLPKTHGRPRYKRA